MSLRYVLACLLCFSSTLFASKLPETLPLSDQDYQLYKLKIKFNHPCQYSTSSPLPLTNMPMPNRHLKGQMKGARPALGISKKARPFSLI